LLGELDRARVVEQDKVPGDAVRIGTTLEYRTDDGEPRYARTLRLAHGPAALDMVLSDHPGSGDVAVPATMIVTDRRDVDDAVARARRLIDADLDPGRIVDGLGGDPVVGALVRAAPGLRVPGHVDGTEVAVRAVLGQQISVARARTLLTGLVRTHGDHVEVGPPDLNRLMPTAAVVAGIDDTDLPMPRRRARAIRDLCAAVAGGTIRLDPPADPASTRDALLAIPGIGPWTADYIAMRALGDPDVFLPTDLGTRRALAALGVTDRPAGLTERWRPWRSYAQVHLWHSLARGASRDQPGTGR